MTPMKEETKVIIIGAGMSGISAASALIEAGWNNVRVLEAKDHIGGRTYTHPIPGTPAKVDIGASWMLGNVKNPVAAACDAYHISYDDHPVKISAFVDANHGDRRLTVQEFEKLQRLVPEMVKRLTPEKSASETIKEYLDEKGVEDRNVCEFIMEQCVAGTSGLVDRLAAYFPVKEKTGKVMKGGDHVIDGGYSALMSAISMGVNTDLEQVVERIHLNPDGTTIDVICESGKVHTADYVILTAPLGVLKAGSIEFKPPLSLSKRDAMGKLDMGNFEKVIMVFKHRFWENFNDMAPFKDNMLYYNKSNAVGFRPFSNFIDVTRFSGAPTVVCLYDGMFARTLQDDRTITEDEVVHECRKAFATALKMDPNDLPPCTGHYITTWRSDPYAYGSFSYFVVGSKPEDMDELAKPEWNGRLMFAGEHTIAAHNATAHGAIMSGVREAKRLDPEAFFPGLG